MQTKQKKVNKKVEVVPPPNTTSDVRHLEGADPEMCCGCGRIFPKNTMYPSPDGLMCETDWKKSKYSA